MTVHIKLYDTLKEAKRDLKRANAEWESYTLGDKSPDPIFWIGPTGSNNNCYRFVLNSSDPATDGFAWKRWLEGLDEVAVSAK